MRELNSDEIKLVSGGTQSKKKDPWASYVYKQYWKDAFDNAKNVRAADEAAYAWLDAAWQAENNPPPATDPVPAPAPQPPAPPAPAPAPAPAPGGFNGGTGWWDHHVNLH